MKAENVPSKSESNAESTNMEGLHPIEVPVSEKAGGSVVATRRAWRPPRFIDNDTALANYLREISQGRILTFKEEVALAVRIRRGDQEAVKTLVQANLRFVVAVCRNYQNQGLPLEDLINEGNLGLIRAAKRFDETLNFKFISYAVWWIRQAILVALADQSRVINVPLSRVAEMHKMGIAVAKLEQRLGRLPSSFKLSESTRIGIREINENLGMSATSKSLHSAIKEGEEGRLEEMLEDTRVEVPDSHVMANSLQASVKSMLETLEIREADVLRLYYGIGMETTYSLAEIGGRFGLTRERVRQIKEKALRRLRHPSRLKNLRQFYSSTLRSCSLVMAKAKSQNCR